MNKFHRCGVDKPLPVTFDDILLEQQVKCYLEAERLYNEAVEVVVKEIQFVCDACRPSHISNFRVYQAPSSVGFSTGIKEHLYFDIWHNGTQQLRTKNFNDVIRFVVCGFCKDSKDVIQHGIFERMLLWYETKQKQLNNSELERMINLMKEYQDKCKLMNLI